MRKAFEVSVDVAVTPEQAWAVIGDPLAVPHVWFFPHRITVRKARNG